MSELVTSAIHVLSWRIEELKLKNWSWRIEVEELILNHDKKTSLQDFS